MSIRYLSGINVDSNTLFVDDANNRVGIGTNSPSRQLELVGADAYIQLTRSSTSTQATLGFNTGATNDWLIRTGDGSTSNLQFYSYGTSSYVMTIARSSGNVGIGTTSPSQKLDVVGNAKISADILLGTAGVSNNIYFADATSTQNVRINSYTDNTLFFDNFNGQYNFRTTNSYVSRLYIANGGNVGIGTDSPAAKLQVVETSNSATTYPLIINNQNNQAGDGWGAGIKFSTSNPASGGNEANKWSSIEAFDVNNFGSSSGLSFTVSETYTKTKAMVITRTGAVGIGTTTPAQKLHVVGNTTITGVTYTDVVQTYSGASIDFRHQDASVVMRVDTANARVGIGTTSPGAKLQVGNGTSNSPSSVAVLSADGGNAVLNALSLVNSRSAANGNGTSINFHNANNYGPTGRITSVQDSGTNASLRFSVYNSTDDALVERITLLSSGNVGIGTTSPVGNANANARVLQVNGSGANPPEIKAGGDNAEISIAGGNAASYLWATGNYPLVIATNASEKMRITAGGNVGIGTTSPNAQLDAFTTQGGSTIAATHGTGGTYPKASGISFGATSTSLSVSNNGGTVVFTGGAGIYANNGAASNNPTELVFWTTSAGSPAARLTIASTGATRLNAYGSGSFTGTVAYNLAVDSSGNIIETAGGVVDGSGTANYVSKWSDANTLTNSLLYDNGSTISIGLGSTTPSYTNAYGYPQFAIESNAFASSHVFTHNDTNGNYSFFALGKSKGTAAAPTIVENSETIGDFQFWAYDGAAYRNTAFIRNQIDGEPGAGDVPGRLVFGTTNDGSSAASEKMRITSAGNVGIGTTSPSNKFVSVNDATFNGENSYSIAAAASSDTGYKTVIGYDYANDIGVISAVRQGIQWKNLSILPVGNTNLGVGTITPSQRLHVSGNVRVTGAYYDSNNEAGSANNFLTSTGTGTDWKSQSDLGLVDGSGTANKVSKWSDANTLTDANITDNGTTVRINSLPLMADSRLAIGTAGSDQTYASLFIGGNLTEGSSQYALLLDPQLDGTTNYGMLSNARIAANVTATTAYGIYQINNELLSGASIVNNFGIYIANQTSGTTQNWNLYSVSGKNYFGGNVLIGTTTDAGYKLQVEGSIRSVGAMEPSTAAWVDAAFTTKVGGSAYGGGLALIDGTAGWAMYTTGSGQYLNLSSGTTSGGVTTRMSLKNNGVVRLNAYGSGGVTGTATYNLAVDANGDIIETLSPTLATSLYDLLPAGRVAYNWTGQVVNDTWTTIFSKSDNILTTGTWMVQMYISDFAVGGGHYTYTYTGVMQWYQDTVNQTGEAAFSEIYLHRMGHAANASVLYLRTAESGAAAGNLGYFQIKGNYSNTSNTTINFKFVKIF